MKRVNLALVFILVFLVGCVGTLFAQELLVPPVTATESSEKWEYTCKKLNGSPLLEGAQQELNHMGQKGWELILQGPTSPNAVCFKRPLQ